MDKAFQHDYAKAVALFTQKIPPELKLTYAEIDDYFRLCILHLISCREQTGNKPDLKILNQIYTEAPVQSPAGQTVEAAASFPSEVAVPDFFHRMLAADAASGTCISREFIQLQQEVLMLYASSEAAFSFEESRRLTFLSDRLTVLCDQEGVAKGSTPESEGANVSQAAIEGLNNQLTKAAKSVFRKKTMKIGREPGAEKILKNAERMDRELDQIGGTQQSLTESKREQDDSAPTYGIMKTEDLMRGRGPDRFKKVSKRQDEEGPKLTLEEALAKLNGMIGLDEVKNQVQSLIDYLKISKLREKHGAKSQPMSYHMVFTGNPGTGKTTVAGIVAEIYAALGILRKGQLITVARKDLVGEYVGKTEKKTGKIIKKALGGVLFIDEAYLLSGPDDKNDYGYIAVGTILKAMEDHRDDLVVIVAGYGDEMKDFIESNPGLKSRFATKIKFEDYNGEQLYKIFLNMVQAGGYQLSVQANILAAVYFHRMYQNRNKKFGNGRDVRNSYERLRRLQATRLSQKNTELTKEELDTFTSDDIIALANTVDAAEDQKKGDKKGQEDGEEAELEETD